MTGCMLTADDFCLVIAEGSQKSHKKYSRLMLNRIDWNQSQEEEQQGCFRLTLVCCVTATQLFHLGVAIMFSDCKLSCEPVTPNASPSMGIVLYAP